MQVHTQKMKKNLISREYLKLENSFNIQNCTSKILINQLRQGIGS